MAGSSAISSLTARQPRRFMAEPMIDNFALAVSHGLMLLAAWRLLSRADLDDDAAPPAADARGTGWPRLWNRPGA